MGIRVQHIFESGEVVFFKTPAKLQKNDLIRVIAPARSLALINDECRSYATQHLEMLGLRVSFGKHAEEQDGEMSSSIASRISDLHDAFADPEVKGILTVIGGWNSNQLLRDIDWELIRKNPKIFCGFSDITALTTAITSKTQLVTYSGPHYSSFGQKLHWEYTQKSFQECLFQQDPIEILPSKEWTDDPWFLNQDDRHPILNHGFWVMSEGSASGTIFGGNVSTFNLLAGTSYFPDLQKSIIFIEDTAGADRHIFDRELESLIQQQTFSGVRGMVIGRFQPGSKIDQVILGEILASKPELKNMPILANVDFGHTDPRITFPIGGEVALVSKKGASSLVITSH